MEGEIYGVHARSTHLNAPLMYRQGNLFIVWLCVYVCVSACSAECLCVYSNLKSIEHSRSELNAKVEIKEKSRT